MEFCQDIARVLKVPPERVFRKAGHLPPRIIGNDEADELLDFFESLNERNRQTILSMAHTLHEQQAEYNHNGS